eukprot:TRINITY_DN5010_c0_g1_i1.p1 TRINITY_DN5010_c0_g1~~TRINITY_DN5010_c0_g1_i1.p1  ORF type:complete len:316 (+),score=126.00 TRINITY_DN5010_c0_g1_i1:1039-1986(+)
MSFVKQAIKATESLKKFAKNEDNELIEEHEPIQISFSVKKIGGPYPLSPKLIELANPINDEQVSVCVFVKDDAKDAIKEKLSGSDIPAELKIIGLKKLLDDFKTHASKRELLKKYDLFFADERIMEFLPKALGKKFFEKKKQPAVIKMTGDKAVSGIKSALNSAWIYLKQGPSINFKIGHTGMESKAVSENVELAFNGLAKFVGGFGNYHTVHLKTLTSPALPIYSSSLEAKKPAKKEVKKTTKKTTKKNKESKKRVENTADVVTEEPVTKKVAKKVVKKEAVKPKVKKSKKTTETTETAPKKTKKTKKTKKAKK